jgi:PAS domain S-box-containing protein
MTGPAPVVSEIRLAAIVESSDDAIMTKDAEGTITSWNRAAERMYGWSAEEAIGQKISILIPEDHAGEEWRILEQVLRGEQVGHYESDRLHRSGRRVRISLSVAPLHDETGEIVGASIISRDITAQHRSRDFAARLQQLTAAFVSEITRKGVVAALLDQSVAGLGADAGAVGLLNEAGDEIELAGSVGYSGPGIQDWQRFPLDADVPMSIAVRTGEPIWIESASELRDRYSGLSEVNVLFSSLAVIPLLIEGRPFGAIALSFTTPRLFDEEERTFLLTAAQHAAQTFDHARLYEDQRRAAERLSFLAAASELLSGSLDPETTMQNLANLAIRELGDWCAIDLADDEVGLRNVATAHVDPELVRLASELRERYPVDPDAPTGAPNVIRTGKSELYEEIPDELLVEAAVDEEHLKMMRRIGLVSGIVAPLAARGRVLGAITFVSSTPGRHFNQSDLELAEDLARRAGLAIDNAMLFRHEHDAAVTLQRSLLPESLPTLPGVQFAARYLPAAPGLEVGGDWYDVTVLGEGRAAMTIGDIAGRGVTAAAVMGHVAGAVRAFVLDGEAPDEVVQRANRVMREASQPQMATAVQLELDVESGHLDYVRAGHPPALLRLPDGTIEKLAGKGTQPLGVFDDLECRTHHVDFPPGSLLLLYTDGLIERSDRDFAEELEKLAEALAQGPADAEACLRSLGERFSPETIPDDVAMLAVSRSQPAR